MLEVHTLPALTDNYIYVLHDNASMETVVIDPSLAKPVSEFLQNKKFSLKSIWNTHHHFDHTGGNLELKNKFSCKIYGPAPGLKAIPGIDRCLSEEDNLQIGKYSVKILETPGHTAKALSFFIEEKNWLFCGDTLFSLGCGRIFEGTAEQLWQSLEKLKKLPNETQVYAAHEYTKQNCVFALSIDPNNVTLQKYKQQINKIRTKEKPTLPSLLSTELKTNPFLRCNSKEIKASTHTLEQEDWKTFSMLRQMKDKF